MNFEYWQKYYSIHSAPYNVTNFARFCSQYLNKEKNILELGCGNGRDCIYFNKEIGLNVTGIDQCEAEINYLNQNYSNERLTFECSDFTDLPKSSTRIDYVYSRFTMHSITVKQEDTTINWVYTNLSPGGKFMIEARSIKDSLYGKGVAGAINEYTTDHYRRFADLDILKNKLLLAGFSIVFIIEDTGLAIYKDEDPVIIRIIASK
jgi:tellurite methyltransferase